jgi:hypothetical protein
MVSTMQEGLDHMVDDWPLQGCVSGDGTAPESDSREEDIMGRPSKNGPRSPRPTRNR